MATKKTCPNCGQGYLAIGAGRWSKEQQFIQQQLSSRTIKPYRSKINERKVIN